MIDPSNYKPEIWALVYPYNGGPELRYYQFGTRHAAEIQRELYMLKRMEGYEDELEDREFYFGETLLFQINTASLNVQNLILELLCGVKDPEWKLGMGSTVVFSLIERLLPDYDNAMYKFLLETRWDELRLPRYPHQIQVDSTDFTEFSPFTISVVGSDEWDNTPFKTLKEAIGNAREQQGYHLDQLTPAPVVYIRNGHNNIVHTVDEEDYRD